MDPEANLKELRELTKMVAEADLNDKDGLEAIAETAPRMAELFQALDEWLTKGGFLPKDWSHQA